MSDDSDVIYIPEVARKMGMTEAAVRGHIQRNTDAIPPWFPLGKSKRPRIAWRRSTVDAWLEKQEQQAQNDRPVRPARRRSGGSNS